PPSASVRVVDVSPGGVLRQLDPFADNDVVLSARLRRDERLLRERAPDGVVRYARHSSPSSSADSSPPLSGCSSGIGSGSGAGCSGANPSRSGIWSSGTGRDLRFFRRRILRAPNGLTTFTPARLP